ncbi:hypothetical protein QYF36_014668 [Acer negundo]|nr:hypothetical protein QYF36_014668 [Acer negundo]
MYEVLGLEALVGEKFRQEVEIPWSDEPNQQPNNNPTTAQSSSLTFHSNDANYNSDDKVPNNASEDEVPNDASEYEVPNENDSANENDGLFDVNEDDIADEEVVDQSIMGIAFRTRNDGRITLEVGRLFRNSTHFREILLDYSIQEGFKLKRIKNEKRRITVWCETDGCPWRVHSSSTFDRVTYILKTLRNDHN